jgi:CheY-like chemotaxis protein
VDAQTAGASEPLRKSGTKLRVLLVEDNPADVELELLILRKDDFDVSGDVAQTAEEFIARVRSTNYDVIHADYSLPQWKGTDAARNPLPGTLGCAVDLSDRLPG